MANTKLSPPWNEYVIKIKALFEKDPDIHMEYSQEKNTLLIKVEGTDKYNAMTHLLPAEKDFGGVKLFVTIVPANKAEKDTREYIKDLFKGNRIVTKIEDVAGPISNSMTFIEFEKEVVQYYNDNIGDLHGNRTTVMEEIAREIFENREGVFFCTDNNYSF